MLPNQIKAGPVWRIDTQAVINALTEFALGQRKMSETQLKAATLLLNIAGKIAMTPPASDAALEDLA